MNYIYSLLEKYSGRISCWAWNKRWSKNKYARYISSKSGKFYTIDKKTGSIKHD